MQQQSEKQKTVKEIWTTQNKVTKIITPVLLGKMLGNGKVREMWSYRDCLTGTNIVHWKRAIVGLDLQASRIVNYFPAKEQPFSIITPSYSHLHLLLDFLPAALSIAIPTVKIAKKKVYIIFSSTCEIAWLLIFLNKLISAIPFRHSNKPS